MPEHGLNGPRWNEVLRALRDSAGLTQAGWASLLGVGEATVQRWERGSAVPSQRHLETIIRVCQDRRLFRQYSEGPLQGITVTGEFLHDLLLEARSGRTRVTDTPEAQPETPPFQTIQALELPAPRRESSRRLVPRRLLVPATGLIFMGFVASALLVLMGRAGLPSGEDSNGPAGPGSPMAPAAQMVEFYNWIPAQPTPVRVGQEVSLGVGLVNPGEDAVTVYAAVSLRDPDGEWVDIRPLRRVDLGPGEQGSASWVYTPKRKGAWDLVYGKWGSWAEGEEPQEPIANTGIIRDSIVAFQECPTDAVPVAPATIFAYAPFLPAEVKAGDTVSLSLSFTNISDRAWAFVAGATVWDSEGNSVTNGDYETALDEPLPPGESATVRWEHAIVSAGSYQLQFAVWDRDSGGMLVRAPCPREKLMVAYGPTAPAITGIEPDQPRSSAARQWISIKGENFTERSVAVLSILGNRYTISQERTEFVNAEELRVFAGLTEPGNWTVQVINTGDVVSNAFEFQVLP